MTRYTQEKKEHALSLMAAPQNKPVAEVAQVTGIPEAAEKAGEVAADPHLVLRHGHGHGAPGRV